MLVPRKRRVLDVEGIYDEWWIRNCPKIDVKGNAIVVYTADQDIETLAEVFKDMYSGPSANTQLMTLLRNEIHYSPMLQFMLEDAQRRTFVTQRYCFRGVD